MLNNISCMYIYVCVNLSEHLYEHLHEHLHEHLSAHPFSEQHLSEHILAPPFYGDTRRRGTQPRPLDAVMVEVFVKAFVLTPYNMM